MESDTQMEVYFNFIRFLAAAGIIGGAFAVTTKAYDALSYELSGGPWR
mgnify:FL=1